MTRSDFARALVYANADAYPKYETRARAVPNLLVRLAAMIERHGLPNEWCAEPEGTD